MKKEEDDFQLTDSQQELKPKMADFLDSSERSFLLIGKPGVGKTTMTKIMLKEHIEADTKAKGNSRSRFETSMNVAGISLSHQAKNVLGEHIPNVFTFAKAYGLKEKINSKTGKRTFEFDKNNRDVCIGECDIPVFVHDEVSQYTQEMIDIVFEKTPIFSKIIFMGDKAQLPPIDPDNKLGPDADSPIFTLNFNEECKHELTERVRQAKGNPILELSDVIREEIFGNKNIKRVLDIISTPKLNDGVGYSFVKYSELLEHIEGKDHLETRLIAFRNKTINYFNIKIRNHVLNNPEDLLIDDDIVCMRDNYYKIDEMGFVKYIHYNSDTYQLENIYTCEYKYTAGEKTWTIECHKANIKSKYGVFIAPTEKGQLVYNFALQEILEKCKIYMLPWKVYYEFTEQFCNYMYGYAITAYKAQGSSYDSIYLDINDVLLTRPLTPKRKLQTIYTAITRARNNVYFLKGR